MIQERIRNGNGPTEPNETGICVHIQTEITDEELFIIDELKALMIADEYLPFKKVDQRKLRDVNKKVNAVIKHVETDDITQTSKLAMAAALWFVKEVGVKAKEDRKKNHGGK